MFNAEKLLGTVLRDVIGTGSHKKKRKHRSSLLDSLSSGAGLMTVIGLGVGAMEILKDKQRQSTAGGYGTPGYPQPPHGQPAPQPNWSAPAQPPPPPPPQAPSPAAVPPQAPSAAPAPGDQGQLAIRMIQAMIAAAHADGTLDAAEEQAILDRVSRAGLSQEERMFFLDELHKPKSIAELTAGIDPSAAKTMYLLAASAIAVDTEAERQWLDRLAEALGLSRAVQKFIEEQG